MRLPQFELYHLLVFYLVAKEKSISLAADTLCLSQPAVTSHIKSLERSTRLKLVELNKQRISLTRAGEGLYQYAKEIYQQSVYAERFIELTRESSLCIGITPIFNGVIAPLLKNMFIDLYPKVKLIIDSKDSRSLINDVLDSTVDVAIVPVFDQANPKLNYTTIASEVKMIFFASPSNPIFQKEKVEWADLCNYPLIVGSEISIFQQFILDKLKLEGMTISPTIGPILRGGNSDLGKMLVKHHNFISIGIKKDIEHEINDGTLRIILCPDDILIDVSAVVYRNTPITQLVEKFISLIRESFRSSNVSISASQ